MAGFHGRPQEFPQRFTEQVVTGLMNRSIPADHDQHTATAGTALPSHSGDSAAALRTLLQPLIYMIVISLSQFPCPVDLRFVGAMFAGEVVTTRGRGEAVAVTLRGRVIALSG